MKFLNKTIYDRKTLEKLNQTVSWSVNKRGSKANQILSALLPLALFGSGFYLFREQGATPLAVIEMVIGGILLVFLPSYYRIQAWMASKLMLKGDPEYTVDFNEKGYVVSSTTTHGAPTDRTKYDTIWRLCETRDYFVLLLDKRSGYILSKQGFVEGDADSFRTFIEYKVDQYFEKLAI